MILTSPPNTAVGAPVRIETAYQWRTVIEDYETLFERIAAGYYDVFRQSD